MAHAPASIIFLLTIEGEISIFLMTIQEAGGSLNMWLVCRAG